LQLLLPLLQLPLLLLLPLLPLLLLLLLPHILIIVFLLIDVLHHYPHRFFAALNPQLLRYSPPYLQHKSVQNAFDIKYNKEYQIYEYNSMEMKSVRARTYGQDAC
jgi:hypothetical protein